MALKSAFELIIDLEAYNLPNTQDPFSLFPKNQIPKEILCHRS